MSIYKNKEEHLRRILKEKGIDPAQAVYIGDSLDDEGCMNVCGRGVVSLSAQDDVRQLLGKRCGAFTPKTGDELAGYLKDL